jgi:tetratricopeptide (TPR) repeat protein
MTELGNGLQNGGHYEVALSVEEAYLAMLRRLGESESHILVAQGNLAGTYYALGRVEDAIPIERDVYFGRLKLCGKEHKETLRAAFNYALSLLNLKRYEEARSVLRKTIPVAPNVLGERDELTLKINWNYPMTLYNDDGSTLGDLREAVTTLERTALTARRVLGSAHPTTAGIKAALRGSRAALCAREKSAVSSICEAVKVMTPRGA